ncbi:type II toxin-antitoxin system RelE/ParE family toxin [Sediminibacterium salmoneum]|uniref:type II toxin-antitoxin system RelE/ParE family toxin n=1 Tax=Sediminibacterium salmoneum TaxID=426421 RepID=UPI00047A83CB|nr:type II toxin-antitoxin system RelE/ParE family toxin [Sediminibacterium salmoneum]
MGSYTLTNKAVQDLSSIWEYTVDTWSEKQADKYYIMLLDSCQDIADGKVMGKYYPEVSTEILGFKAGQHILFYRKLSITKVEIARILHSQMDLKNRLQE